MASVSNIRRKAKRLRYVVKKSRWRVGTSDNYGEYMLIDARRNVPMLGFKFDASLEEIDQWLEREYVLGKQREDGAIYLNKTPKAIPIPGKIVVHNHVRPASPLNRNGFRAWLADPDDARYEACTCHWAPHLGTHYRLISAWRDEDGNPIPPASR
jgi:hypothetical protein